MKIRARIWLVIMASLTGTISSFAQSSDIYPERSVRVVTPSGPGGGTDVTARLVTRSLAAQLKQPFVVENKPGAAGTIGAAQVAKAAPDGYTLMWTGNSPLTLAPLLYKDVGYDPLTAFVPISTGVISSFALMVAPDSPIGSVEDLLAKGRQERQNLAYASNGQNGTLHLLGLLLTSENGVDALHVPYKGGAEGVTAVMTGQVDFTFDAVSTAVAFVKNGKVKVLAITGKTRDPALPSVPTFQELGMPSMTSESFFGLLAPAGMPQRIVDRLAAAMETAVADPEIAASILSSGNNPRSSTPHAFLELIRHDAAHWKDILQDRVAQLAKDSN